MTKKMKNCCSAGQKSKKCVRTSDKKIFSLPRRFSRKKCTSGKPKGFTMRASCAAYKGCARVKKGGVGRTGTQRPQRVPQDVAIHLYDLFEHHGHDTTIGNQITRLTSDFIDRPTSGSRSPSPNSWDNTSEGIETLIQNGITQTNTGDPIPPHEQGLYYASLLDIMNEDPDHFRRVINMIPENRRGIYVNVMNNIRNAIIEKLHELEYPIETLTGPPFFMNVQPGYFHHSADDMPQSPIMTDDMSDTISLPDSLHGMPRDLSLIQQDASDDGIRVPLHGLPGDLSLIQQEESDDEIMNILGHDIDTGHSESLNISEIRPNFPRRRYSEEEQELARDTFGNINDSRGGKRKKRLSKRTQKRTKRYTRKKKKTRKL